MKKKISGLIIGLFLSITSVQAAYQHGIALYGEPKYGPHFTHFDFVNEKAPKGGTLRVKVTGSFDSLNPHIIKGLPGEGHYLTTESLLKRSADEPFAMYGRIAKSVHVSSDFRYVEFLLNEKARFHDGSPVTIDDVIFSFETLKAHGRPQMGLFYTQVEKIETAHKGHIRFYFKTKGDRQLPLLIGYMPILSKKYYSQFPFDKANLNIPLGSGPYTVEKIIPGRSIHYKRVPNYWGEDLPVNRGFYNFDHIIFEYYRDETSSFEAFKAGLYDLREEKNLNTWSLGYQFPAVKKGEVLLDSVPLRNSVGMFGFVFNTRRDLFKDIKVRKALSLMLDLEWLSRVYYHGAYERIRSFFGLNYTLPILGENLTSRVRLTEASKLLKQAGWRLQHNVLTHSKTGKIFTIQIPVYNREYERLASIYARTLKKLGIQAYVRYLDPSQYERKRSGFDYDMILNQWTQALAPGREQIYYWGSLSANLAGSQNYAGIQNPHLDKIVHELTHAPTLEVYEKAMKNLDFALHEGCYVLPLFQPQRNFYAYRNHFGKPDIVPKHGFRNVHWWATQVWWDNHLVGKK
jgi:ABC-type oligopeptide transport system substrate-binding subunit